MPLATVVDGYRQAPSAERAAAGSLASVAATIATSRAINYTLERRRRSPRLRSWARKAYHLPGREKPRIHHFLPGIALAFLAGGAAIGSRDDRRESWFSIPFGIGAGLTLDEISVMAELDNPYWESQRLALAEATAAAGAALVLALRFHRRVAT